MAYASDTRTFGLAFGNRFATLISDFSAARQQRKVFRQTFNELNDLTNRELADLGIHRSAIKAIAHEAAYGK